MSARPHVVVGVDGSEASRAPLRWALWMAGATGARVTVVHALGVPDSLPEGPAALPAAAGEATAVLRGHAEALLERLVADLAPAAPGVPVERVVVSEHGPARALLDRARDADLLVLGTRGQGGHADLALGSVTRYCTHHAACPVVVVPPTWEPRPQEPSRS